MLKAWFLSLIQASGPGWPLRTWAASGAFRLPACRRCWSAWRRRRSRTPQRSWAQTAAGWRRASTQTQLRGGGKRNQPAQTKRCLALAGEGLKQHLETARPQRVFAAPRLGTVGRAKAREGYSWWWRRFEAQRRRCGAGRGSSRIQTGRTAWSRPWGWRCRRRYTGSWEQLPGSEAWADHLAGALRKDAELMLSLE